MSFGAPIFLSLLALAVPIVLLYLLKQRRRRVEVSTLMFWDQILQDQPSVTSFTQLRKLLSLLLQLLFLLLVTLALARPVLSNRLTGARRVVLLVDTSASMGVLEGKRTRFELARERARDVIRGLSMGDTCLLMSVGAEADLVHPFTDSKKELLEALDELKLSHSGTDFRKAWQRVEQLPPDERETQVYLITDGAFDPIDIVPPPRTQFAYRPVGTRSDNVGITAFSVRPLPSSPRDFQAHLELFNDSEEEKVVPLELRIGGRLAEAFEFRVPAGQAPTRTLRQFSAEGGEVEVFADVPDAFPLDNRAYGVLPPPSPIRVRLVTPESPFLERALATDEDLQLEVITPDKFPAASDAAVTVFAGCRPTRTPPGAVIFIGDWPEDLGLARQGEVAKPLFTEWQRDHPVNRHLALQNVGIEKAVSAQPGRDWQRLASSVTDPLVLLREESTNKVLVITFDPQGSDLPLRVAFPILIGNSARYLAGADTSERWVNPAMGQVLSPPEVMGYLTSAQREAGKTLDAVVTPEGGPVSLKTAPGLVPVERAGLYRGIAADGTTNVLFAANLADRRESRLAPSAELPLRSKTPLVEIQERFRLGFEPWMILASLAVLVSVVEWILFHRRLIE